MWEDKIKYFHLFRRRRTTAKLNLFPPMVLNVIIYFRISSSDMVVHGFDKNKEKEINSSGIKRKWGWMESKGKESEGK